MQVSLHCQVDFRVLLRSAKRTLFLQQEVIIRTKVLAPHPRCVVLFIEPTITSGFRPVKSKFAFCRCYTKFSLPLHALTTSQVIANALSSMFSLPIHFLPTSSSLSQCVYLKNLTIVVKSRFPIVVISIVPVLPESSLPEVLLLPAVTSASCLAAVMPASIPRRLRLVVLPMPVRLDILDPSSSACRSDQRFLPPIRPLALPSPLPLPSKSCSAKRGLFNFIPIIPVVFVFANAMPCQISYCRPCDLIRHPRPLCSCDYDASSISLRNCPTSIFPSTPSQYR